MRRAWQTYFAMVPDYWIKVERVLQQDGVVVMLGRAGGTLADNGRLESANSWEVPAAWQAVVAWTRIALWQVFADNEPIRKIMARLTHGSPE